MSYARTRPTVRAQAHSRARIEELLEWFEKADQSYAAVAKFYRQLKDSNLGANKALVQLGWGSGWDGKTFWTHLQKDPALFERLIADFRMHKAGKESPPRKIGDAFPRSKRAAMTVKKAGAKNEALTLSKKHVAIVLDINNRIVANVDTFLKSKKIDADMIVITNDPSYSDEIAQLDIEKPEE